MRKKLSILVALLLALSVVMFTACSDNGSGSSASSVASSDSSSSVAETVSDDSLQKILDKGELILGCDDEFPPMGFIGTDGTLTGFDIELAEAVAERIGVKLVAKPIDWSAKEMELSSGNIDVIWNGYTITAARNEQVEFTKPYLENEQMLVVKADSPIKTKADLAGKIVGAQAESAAEELIVADTDFHVSLAELRVYDDYQAALLDLKSSNRIDAVGVDKILIEYIMQQDPGTYTILEETLGDEYFGIGCRSGEVSLREAIDAALDEMQKDGTTDSICKKWFTQNVVIRDVAKLTASDF